MVAPGGMHVLVTIEQDEGTTTGEPTVDWQTYRQRWFRVHHLSGSESYRGSQPLATVTHRFEGHWEPDLSPRMRLRIGTRVFDIAQIVNVEERNVELHILATEQV